MFSALAADLVDLRVQNGDAGCLGTVVALLPRGNLDAVRYQVKSSELRLAIFVGISRTAQEDCDFFGVGLVAVVHCPGQGVDFCGLAKYRRPEALRNNPVVRDVEIANESHQTD